MPKKKAAPKSHAIHPRQVRVGDIVASKNDPDLIDVVRRVEVVLTLGTGVQEFYQMDEEVVVLPQEELPTDPVLERDLLLAPPTEKTKEHDEPNPKPILEPPDSSS